MKQEVLCDSENNDRRELQDLYDDWDEAVDVFGELDNDCILRSSRRF